MMDTTELQAHCDPLVMLLYILLQRSGGQTHISMTDATLLPVGWRSKVIIAEQAADGSLTFSLTDPVPPRDLADVVTDLVSNTATKSVCETVCKPVVCPTSLPENHLRNF